jgi:hypothetical protein
MISEEDNNSGFIKRNHRLKILYAVTLILFSCSIFIRQPAAKISLNIPGATLREISYKDCIWPEVSALPVLTELPDPLIMFDGTPVNTAEQWRNERRPELISLFQHYMYGYSPPPPGNFTYTVDHTDNTKYGGKATLKLVTLRFGPPGTPEVSMMVVLPNQRKGPVPVFLGLNFPGNHTTADFPEIPLPKAWVNNRWTGGSDNRAHDDQRGIRDWRWPYEMIIDRGYAVATIYAGEISPDYDSGFSEGVHRGYFYEGQERPGRHEWGVSCRLGMGLAKGS